MTCANEFQIPKNETERCSRASCVLLRACFPPIPSSSSGRGADRRGHSFQELSRPHRINEPVWHADRTQTYVLSAALDSDLDPDTANITMLPEHWSTPTG